MRASKGADAAELSISQPESALPLSPQFWRRTFASLRDPRFRTFWLAVICSFMALQMQLVARGWLAYELAGNATALGLVTMAWGLPMLFLSLPSGAVVDRVVKRDLLLVAYSFLGLTALTTAVLVHSGLIQLWHLVLLSFAQGFAFAFIAPTRQAIIPELVPESDLANAVALNSAGMNMSRILGPSLAGALITVPLVGLTGVFYLQVAFYVFVILTLSLLPRDPRPSDSPAPMLQEMRSGLRYIGDTPALISLITLAFVPIVLGLPFQSLLPVFASEKVLDVGAGGLGIMATVVGAGALSGSLLVAALSYFPRKAALQLPLGAAFGISLAAFALSGLFAPALVFLALVGLSSQAYMALNATSLLTNTQPEFYGRVMSVYAMSFSLMPLASLPLGVLADAIGAPVTLAAAGSFIALFVTANALFRPALRHVY